MVIITIDTKKDSANEIRKTIEYLKTFLDGSSSSSPTPDVSEGTFSMFDSGSSADEPKVEEKEPEVEFKPILY